MAEVDHVAFPRVFDELASPGGALAATIRRAFDAIFAGAWTPVQVAGFAIALRMRGEDILTLFTRASEQFAEEYGCDAPQVTAQEAAQLLQAPWPGNVRQMVNIAERAVLQNRRGSGSIASLLMADNEASGPALTTEGKPLKDYVEAFERMLIDNTMRRHKGSITAVMDELCLPRRTLNEKMAKYGLQRQDYVS